MEFADKFLLIINILSLIATVLFALMLLTNFVVKRAIAKVGE